CIVEVRQGLSREGSRYFASDVAERKRTSQRTNHEHGVRIRPFGRVHLLAIRFQFRSDSLLRIDLRALGDSTFLQTTLTDHIGARIVRTVTGCDLPTRMLARVMRGGSAFHPCLRNAQPGLYNSQWR